MKNFWFAVKVIYVTITSLGFYAWIRQFIDADYRAATKDYLDDLF